MKEADIGHQGRPQQDFPHNVSDEDVGNGIDNFHLGQGAEGQARRDQLSRNLEELLVDAQAWLRLEQNDEARIIYEMLDHAYQLLGQPLEDTSDEEISAVSSETKR